MQVWREGTIQKVTGMTYMSILDLVDNDALNDNLDENNEPLLHKCGLEMVDADKQNWYESDGKGGYKGQALQNRRADHGELMHGYRLHFEDIVKFGGKNDWGEVIKMLKSRG